MPGAADPGQVVPQQIDDHHILRPVLVALGQRAAERGVVHRAEAARTGALDRPGLDVPAVLVQQKEALGRGAQHRELAEVEVGGEGGRISAPQLRYRSNGDRVSGGLKPLREIGLEDVAGDDVFAHPGDRVEIPAVGKGRPEADPLGILDAQSPDRTGRSLAR